MTDTQRTVAAIKAALADNVVGAISPQDVRDALETWRMGMGQIYVTGSGAIAIANTTNYYEAVTPTWALSGGGLWFDESGGNGRLTYIGAAPVMAHIAATVSFTAAQNQRLIHWRIGKNGTTEPASEAQRWVSTGSDVGSTALHLVTSLAPGDYLSVWARNETAADNVTLQVANLQAVSMPN